MNELDWLKCTKCNNPMKPVHDYIDQIDDGIKLIFSGGYDMFTDSLYKGDSVAYLCHDCVVLLLEFFPESFRENFKGGHPYSHKPNGRCCEYAWPFADEPLEPKKNSYFVSWDDKARIECPTCKGTGDSYNPTMPDIHACQTCNAQGWVHAFTTIINKGE